MLDLQALEQEVATPQDAQTDNPPPKIPTSVPRTKVSNMSTPPSGALSAAQLDAEVAAFMEQSGYSKKDLEENTGVPIADTAHTKGVLSTLWDLTTSAPKGILKGTMQIGANMLNVSEEAMIAVSNKVFGTNYKAESIQLSGPSASAEERSWAKASEVMGTVAGTMVTAGATLPAMAATSSAAIGGLIAGFTQNTEDGNLSTALQGTKFAKLGVIEPVLSQFAHKPGDPQLIKRLKNMSEGALLDLMVGGAIATPRTITDAAKASARTRVGKAITEAVRDTRDVVRANLGKKPVASATPVETVTPAASLENGNVNILPEEELAAREASYEAQGAAQAKEYAGIVGEQMKLGEVGTQAAPTPEASVAGAVQQDLAPPPAQGRQMDFFEMVSEMEDAAKVRQDAVNLEINMREQKAAAFGERQAAKQRSLFKGRQAKLDDPRLKGEQLSLFNIDEVDTAGFSYDPKQASFFEENFNKALPENFAISEDKFIDIELAKAAPVIDDVAIAAKVVEAEKEIALVNSTKTPAPVGVDAGPNEIKVTFADDSLTESLDKLVTQVNEIYTAKRAAGESMSYVDLQNQAAAKNQQPGEIARVLAIKPGDGMSPLEMAQIQNIAVRATEEMQALGKKVAEGLANDIELVAYESAKENFYRIALKYAKHGTDAAHALGIRGSLRTYARAGDPTAIKAIGNEGKIKAISKIIGSLEGRTGIEDEAKFFAQVMDLVNENGTTIGKVLGDLTPEQTTGVVNEVRKVVKRPDADFIMNSHGEIAAKSRGRTIVEGATGWMFDNMILHPLTMVNTWAGMPFDMGLRVGTNYTMALFSGAKGNIPEALMRLDKANIYGKSLGRNFTAALKAAAREFSGTQAQSAGDVIINSQARVPEYLKEYAQKSLVNTPAAAAAEVDAVRSILTPVRGWTIGLGRKILASSDAFINHLGYNAHVEAELFQRATGVARDMNLKGTQAKNFIDNFVNDGLKNVPADLHEEGLVEGAKLGYRANLDDLSIGGIAPMENIDETLYRHPALKIFMPFFRSYGNTVQNTVKYLPGLAMTLKSSRANLEKSVAEQLVGTGALIGMTTLFTDGHITLPDFFNQSPFKRFGEVDENGKTIANAPLSYRGANGKLTKLPLGGALEKFAKLSGYIALASKYMPEEELGAYISGGTMAMFKTMAVDDQFRSFNMISDLVSAIAKGDDVNKPVKDFGVSIVERFVPFNRLGKEANNTMEQFMVDSTGFSARGAKDVFPRFDSAGVDYVISALENRLKAIVPGSSVELPPEYNILGEPVPAFNASALDVPGILTVTNEKSSDVMARLQKLALHASMFSGDIFTGINVSKLSKSIDVGGTPIELNQREYSRMQAYYGGYNPDTGEVLGSTLRDRVADVFAKNAKTWKNVDAGSITPIEFNEMVADVHQVFLDRRNYAREQIKKDPAIIARMNSITEVRKESKARGLQLINTVIGR